MAQSASHGALPVRHGRGDVSVIESGVPRKQDDASVAKHTVEKQLRREQQGGKGISRCEITYAGGLIKHKV